MKKIISLFLVLILFATVASPITSVAAAAADATPIIYIRGNGTVLYNGEGDTIVEDIGDITFGSEGEDTKNKIIESAANILLPFLTEGLLFDKWDNYGKVLYEELAPLMDEARLDNNGNPRYGTGISQAQAADNAYKATVDFKNSAGLYNIGSYMFHYDWRLDPYYNADLFHEFILKVMDTTGASQVSLYTRCLGGVVTNAYLERYGHLGHIKNVLYGDTLAMGCTTITKGFSGKIQFDSENIQRYEGQLTHCAEIGEGVGFAIPVLADEIIQRTLDLFNQVGATDMLFEPVENLYNRLYKALIPALFQAFAYGSMPAYWATVYEEDFDQAMEVMFGEEGSEAREYYAGLITKITYYREHVTSKLPELYTTFTEEYGIHIGTVSKYGYVNPPIFEDSDALCDSLTTLSDATFGATTAPVGRTLSESYINNRISEGKGKYISPDKQVDLSTALFCDSAWIVKNQHHGFNEVLVDIAYEFCNGTNVTVETSSYPRFTVFDEYTGTWEAMTEENCADMEFMTRPTVEPTIETRLAALMRFLTMIFNYIANLFKNGISFGK